MKTIRLILLFSLFIPTVKMQAQVYNPGFENLNADGTYRNWGNVYLMSVVIIDSTAGSPTDSLVIDGGYYSGLSTDAHSGYYAMELRNSYDYTTNVATAGSITADEDSVFSSWSNFEIVPLNGQPTDLGFYYKYLPQNNDIGLATIQVYDSNVVKIGDVNIILTATGNNYQYINGQIVYSVPNPVAAYYYLNFRTNLPNTPASFGTRLLIDDISLNTITGINEVNKKQNFQLHPNPANDRIILNGDIKSGTTAYIYNLSGQLLTQNIPVISGGIISVQDLPEGIYTLELRNNNSVQHQNFVISR